MEKHNEKDCLRLVQIRDFFSEQESAQFLSGLGKECSFFQKDITIYGKKVVQPRLIAFQGDPKLRYTYSKQTMVPDPWTPLCLKIRKKLFELTGIDFNSVLINFYRDGKDSMGMHADNEPELGQDPVIASVSFGANRPILFKPRKEFDLQPFSLSQPSGSLLIMAGKTQDYWQHGILKSKTREARLNLTFRKIIS